MCRTYHIGVQHERGQSQSAAVSAKLSLNFFMSADVSTDVACIKAERRSRIQNM